MFIRIAVGTRVPAEWIRGVVVVIIILIVVRWYPQLAVPLALGGWLGGWAARPAAAAAAISGGQA